jgi:hypothetical protein
MVATKARTRSAIASRGRARCGWALGEAGSSATTALLRTCSRVGGSCWAVDTPSSRWSRVRVRARGRLRPSAPSKRTGSYGRIARAPAAPSGGIRRAIRIPQLEALLRVLRRASSHPRVLCCDDAIRPSCALAPSRELVRLRSHRRQTERSRGHASGGLPAEVGIRRRESLRARPRGRPRFPIPHAGRQDREPVVEGQIRT